MPDGYLLAPNKRADGRRNYFYDTLRQVRPGDIVFSFRNTFIKAFGIVQREAETTPKSDFQLAGGNWSNTGWFVEVEFVELPNPVKPKNYMEQIQPLLATNYAPLQANGNGLQGVYLTEISSEFGELLALISSTDLPSIGKDLAPLFDSDSEYEINLEIEARRIEGDLEQIQMTKSRRRQGIFKSNVRLIENHCRITGVTKIAHLRASHIKPWVSSDNIEKLDGYNGLLLSPHIDHLFDRGFISFRNTGELMISRTLNPRILEQWKISKNANVGPFHVKQDAYLDFHRELIYQG